MNHVGRSHSQRTNTPRHGATPAPPLRDLTDAEFSEAMDTDAERADELLHATAARFCPRCAVETLASRRGLCLFCDGPTTLPVVGEHHATAIDLPARISSQASAPDHGSNGAGASESNRKAAA